MGSHYKEEKKKIKERYDDQGQNGIEENDHDDHGVDQDHELLEERKAVTRKFLHFERENELDEKHKSFREHSHQKSKDKCGTFKKSLKRFVIILVIISVICGSVYLISSILAKRRLKTFSLRGNETHFATFEGIDSVHIPPQELGFIHLENVQLNPSDFLRAIKDSTSLKSIKLQNIKIISGDFNDTVYLPQLKNFFYDESSDQGQHRGITNIGSKVLMPEEKLKSILFFRNDDKKSPTKNVDLSLIWSMNININITFDSTTVIIVNHTRGELVLPWVGYLKREEIIQNAGKELKRLSCNRLKLSIDALPSRLTHLTLRDVKLMGGDFTTLVTKLSNLVDIRVGFPELTSLDLMKLPRNTLRHLALSKFALFNSQPGGGNLFNLEEGLTLMSTNLTMDVSQEFSTIFKIGDESDLALSEYTLGDGSHLDEPVNNDEEITTKDDANQIFLKQLVQTRSERIIMYKYRGASGSFEPDQWPMISGISKDTGNFILERRRRSDDKVQWNFKHLDFNQWHYFKHHAMGLDKFWAHAGSIY